jgi:hypothetical protein
MTGYGVFVRVAALVGLLGVYAASAIAVPVTWTLSGATFTDGGTASGYFVYDADTDTLSTFSVVTAAGNTVAFPATTYDLSTAFGSIDSSGAGTIGTVLTIGNPPPGPGQRPLRMPAVSALSDAGGSVALNLLSPYQGECYNCNPYRFFNAGNLVGTVAPAITSASSANFTLSTAGSFSVVATGTPTPALTISGILPGGIHFVDHGDGTATLSGTPTQSGVFVLVIAASNGSGLNATQSFTLNIALMNQAPALGLPGILALILLLLASACRWRMSRKRCG